MKVTMRTKISGTRNGQDWPNVGGQITLPDDEAKQLIDSGHAFEGKVKVNYAGARIEDVTTPGKVETATAPTPETATPARGRGRRSAKDTATTPETTPDTSGDDASSESTPEVKA